MMKNLFQKETVFKRTIIWKLIIASALALATLGCGKDDDEGEVTNELTLPTDDVLNLYCVDFGLHDEKCVLDDPNNPYANVPFVTENPPADDEPGEDFNRAKFELANAAPSVKAKFYVFATAQARSPSGENQWYTAQALHELYTSSDSDLIKLQTIRAYRSALDNYFDSATFFVADFLPSPPPEGITYPVKIRELTALNLSLTPAGFTPLFDPGDTDNNAFSARETLGGWGYTWVGMVEGGGGGFQIPGPVTRN